MAEKEDKRSTRTKMLDAEYEKNPGVITGVGRMLSRAGDAVGFTQEDEYKDKTKEDLAKRKRAGGKIVNHFPVCRSRPPEVLWKHRHHPHPPNPPHDPRLEPAGVRAGHSVSPG